VEAEAKSSEVKVPNIWRPNIKHRFFTSDFKTMLDVIHNGSYGIFIKFLKF